MKSTPLICSSMGVATDSSSVCALAPTYVAWIRISGGTMLGNWAIGRMNIETAPTSTMMMAITMATMGRLMKNRYMVISFGGSGPGIYRFVFWLEDGLLVCFGAT